MDEFESQVNGLDGSPMLIAGVAMHESFRSMVEAGFTEQQALYLMGVMLATAQTQKNEDD
jgi:hypothetical protein